MSHLYYRLWNTPRQLQLPGQLLTTLFRRFLLPPVYDAYSRTPSLGFMSQLSCPPVRFHDELYLYQKNLTDEHIFSSLFVM